MKIDRENLEMLTVVITEMSSTVRVDLLNDQYTEEEFEAFKMAFTRMQKAINWTVNYFDYYQTITSEEFEAVIGEFDNTLEVLPESENDADYFSSGAQVLKTMRKSDGDQISRNG